TWPFQSEFVSASYVDTCYGIVSFDKFNVSATNSESSYSLVPAQVLVNQLKGVAPAIQNSISELSSRDEVTDVTSRLSSVHIDKESSSDEVTDVTSRLSSVQIDKVSSNPAVGSLTFMCLVVSFMVVYEKGLQDGVLVDSWKIRLEALQGSFEKPFGVGTCDS
ncbi:hypothetical protein Tco_0974477, partial [Tanacetum coccineum]